MLESLTEFSLSGADRERAVDLLKQHPDASNRALARMAGINDKTIAKLRRELGGTSPFPRPGCREAVRTLPHFGDGSNPGEGAEGGAEGAMRAPQRLSRDYAVWRLCQVIKRADGLRDGLHSLACIFQDECGQIQTLPLYLRRQIARRIKEALGSEAFPLNFNRNSIASGSGKLWNAW